MVKQYNVASKDLNQTSKCSFSFGLVLVRNFVHLIGTMFVSRSINVCKCCTAVVSYCALLVPLLPKLTNMIYDI